MIPLRSRRLLDLSTGPSRNAGPYRRLLFSLSTVIDSVGSKFGLTDPPLQTLLTTSMRSFAEIRRQRDRLLGPFPSDEDFTCQIDSASATSSMSN